MTALFRYLLRVRYQECDSQHVVFHSRYSDYVDLALTEFLRAIFPGRDPFDGSFETKVVRQLIEWKGPARFNDVIEIAVAATGVGATSFTIASEMRIAGGEPHIATAETVYVLVDGKTWLKRAVTEAEATALRSGAAGVAVDHAGYTARA